MTLAFFTQSASSQEAAADSITYTQPYGLRVGVDLSRPLIGALSDNYSGVELVGDYRLSYKWFLAAEIGNEERTVNEQLDNIDQINLVDIYNLEVSGSYIKVGADYNTYENWYGMNNSIFVGGRYAFSTFTSRLTDYSIYSSNRYWNENGFAPGSEIPSEFEGLSASWLEILFGIKAELFANIYMGASVRLGLLVSNKKPDNFDNLWIPGFNRVTDNSSFGANFNYTISYMIPLYRKAKKKAPVELSPEVPEN